MIHVLASISGGVMLSERVQTSVPTVGSRPTDVSSRSAYHCEQTSAVYSKLVGQLELKQCILTEMKKKTVPTFDELMNPTLQALKRLGGSASIDELVPEIVRLLELPQELADVPHGATGRTELEYRSAWARTYLRKPASSRTLSAADLGSYAVGLSDRVR